MEGEDAAGARLRVQPLCETGLDAGGFVAERQGPAPSGQRARQALGVAGGLNLDAGQRAALLLGLDHAGGLAIYIKQVVGKTKTRVKGKFTEGNATGRMDVGIIHIADVPACL